jgi:uncharacterized protein YbjT (DUF2867 family)
VSLLLIGIEGDAGEAIVRRLISQGDEVRVVEDDPDASKRWKSLGAYVARPDYDMTDLVERAAQNVRTIVIGEDAGKERDQVQSILEGAGLAGVERLVMYSGSPVAAVVDAIRESRLQYLVLSTRGVSAEDLAEAIDAADDIAGRPRLELDLTETASWVALGFSDR